MVIAVAFFRFTADDSFIVARYGRNLAEGRGLVFNAGERVNALTSSLHAFLLGGLDSLGLDAILVNKVLGLLAVAAAAALVAHYARGERALALAGIVTSPFLILWAVGGLETPYLTLVVATLVVVLIRAGSRPSPSATALVSTLVGLAFLTRDDSVVFTLPVVVWLAWRNRSARGWAALGLPLALIGGGWLAATESYYGDIFPTSFYVKGGSVAFQGLPSIFSVLTFVLFSGLVWLLLPVSRRPSRFALAAIALGSIAAAAAFADLYFGHVELRSGWVENRDALLIAAVASGLVLPWLTWANSRATLRALGRALRGYPWLWSRACTGLRPFRGPRPHDVLLPPPCPLSTRLRARRPNRPPGNRGQRGTALSPGGDARSAADGRRAEHSSCLRHLLHHG